MKLLSSRTNKNTSTQLKHIKYKKKKLKKVKKDQLQKQV